MIAIFLYLFVYLLDQWNDSSNVLLPYYCRTSRNSRAVCNLSVIESMYVLAVYIMRSSIYKGFSTLNAAERLNQFGASVRNILFNAILCVVDTEAYPIVDYDGLCMFDAIGQKTRRQVL